MTIEELKQLVDDLIPPGTIVAFGGDGLPTGWEICNGQEVKITDPKYIRLYKAIGTGWGGSETSTFFLPDLRGKFLRGVSGEVLGIDPEKDNRDPARPTEIAIPNQGNKGNRVGSTQSDAFRQHHHSYNSHKGQADGGNVYWAYGFYNNSGLPENQTYNMTDVGGTETRPVNTYVYFIIKL